MKKKPRTVKAIPNAARTFPDGSMWVPTGNPVIAGARPNPGVWTSWGKPTRATLFVGLTVGRATETFHKGMKIPDRLLYGLVYEVRISQVGTEYGASFVRQKGHYIPPEATRPGPEKRRREDSMQIVLYPAPTEKWATFRRNVSALTDDILDFLGQDSVIVEYVKDGRIVELGQFVWKASRRKSRK